MTVRRKRGVGLVLVVMVAGLVAALLTPATGGAAAPKAVAVGTTINVGGLGLAKTYANDAPVGAQARLERANKTNEVKGYTFAYKGFADDNNDPSTALSEARRLVSQEGVVAIVPDVSIVPPTDYLAQSQIPSFGGGYSTSYCPASPATSWDFAIYGCLIPENPKVVANTNWVLLKKALAAKGIKNPTAALIGTDSTSGKVSVAGGASGAQAAGFKVVYAKGAFPAPPTVVGDFSPYATAIMTANNGAPPDVLYSSIPATSALALFNLIKSQGFTGTILSPFYSSILLTALKDSYVFVQFSGYESNTAGVKQMLADVDAFKPGAPRTGSLDRLFLGRHVRPGAQGHTEDEQDAHHRNDPEGDAEVHLREQGHGRPDHVPRCLQGRQRVQHAAVRRRHRLHDLAAVPLQHEVREGRPEVHGRLPEVTA